MSRSTYGQYCPLAMSCELLTNRWTLLVIRELLDGSTRFNAISRGVPLMSRTLLSRRLAELENAGLVERGARRAGGAAAYRLTGAGEALGPVVRAMAEWGQEWIDVDASLQDVDAAFLMWDIRRNVVNLADLPRPFVVRFFFSDAPAKVREHWLVFDAEEVDLCYIDPGLDVSIEVEADLRTMVQVWMGWLGLETARRSGALQIRGPRQWTERTREWLGLSGLAGVRKRPHRQRVLQAG